MLVTSFECWCPTLPGNIQGKEILDVGDQNGQNRHQNPKFATNTFRLQHPSPTLMLP